MSISKRLFTFSMVVFLLGAAAAAQEPDVPPPVAVTLTAEQARILEGIRANDWRAIRDAGRSRNRIYLEALAAALPRRRDIPGDYIVQEALAQLGDTGQLQELWCWSIGERTYSSSYISFRLAQVGGWFAIRAFEYLMSPTGQTPTGQTNPSTAAMGNDLSNSTRASGSSNVYQPPSADNPASGAAISASPGPAASQSTSSQTRGTSPPPSNGTLPTGTEGNSGSARGGGKG